VLLDYNAWASVVEEVGAVSRPRANELGLQEFIQILRDKDFVYLKNRAKIAGLRPKPGAENAS
jgi:hypothetical protein